MSFHVARLEEALGTRLLDRGSRRVQPTEAGQRLLPRARELLTLADAARDDVVGGEPGGTVQIEASTVPATFLLPRVLARMDAPGVSVTLKVSDSARALTALLERRCDIAVVGSRPRDGRVLTHRVGEDHIVLVGRIADPVPTRLEEVTLVVREPESGTRRAAAGVLPDRGRRVQVGSTEATRRCVLEGVGYSLLSDLAVEEDVRAGRLRVFEWPDTPIRRSFYAARLRQVTPSAATRRLWSALRSS